MAGIDRPTLPTATAQHETDIKARRPRTSCFTKKLTATSGHLDMSRCSVAQFGIGLLATRSFGP